MTHQNPKNAAGHVLDFDSILVPIESIPYLARISLRHRPKRVLRIPEVEHITDLTTNGKTSMAECIALRIEILGQYLKTNERVGCVIKDVSKKYKPSVIKELR